MAFGSGKKPANQGSAGTPKIQKPRTSGKPKGAAAPGGSTFRGTHTAGKGGTKPGPKPFKG